MNWLVFHVGPNRYALRRSDVMEVLPLVELFRSADAPVGCAGLFTYRGEVLPVVDLPMLVTGTACVQRLSNRLILVQRATTAGPQLVGILAERVAGLQEVNPRGEPFAGKANGNAPSLGPIVADAEGLIRLIDVAQLNPQWLGGA